MHSRQTVGFMFVFVSLFYIFLITCFLRLLILLVCLWGYYLTPILSLLRKLEDLPHVLHMAFVLISFGIWTFFTLHVVNFVYLFLITLKFSFGISFSDYSYWIVLLYPVFFFLIAVHSCSTSPICVVQCQALPLSRPLFFCEMMQLEYLPFNCNHFSGRDESRGYIYCARARGRWKSL